MEVMEAIRKRRSVSVYKPDPIDQKTLDTILDAGRLAPSWDNTQTWRFVVVRDTRIKTELADRACSPGSPNSSSLKQAPVVIAACAEINRAGVREGKGVTDRQGYWFMFDSALALENMVLEAEELGVGTHYIGAFDAGKAGAVLAVPKGYTCVIFLLLGYADEQPEAKPRKALAEVVFSERFGQR